MSEEKISEFDEVLIKCLRRIFGIGDTIRACYQPKVKGGFGVRLPSIVYRASRIAHLISMLNHEEDNIRSVARNSLELDMHKRSISRVHHGRNCLGFEMKDDGKFSTKVKGGFGVASDWPHLNLLTCKVEIELVREKPNAKDLMEGGSSGFLLWGAGGAPQNDFCPLKFSKTIERTIGTIAYCFKNNCLLSFASP